MRDKAKAHVPFEHGLFSHALCMRGMHGHTHGSCAAFKHIYESRDGKMCVFEDASGHLVSVRTSRLI